MSKEDDIQTCLLYVRDLVERYPDAAVRVGMYASAGLQAALDKTNERAADMEVALISALMRKHRATNALELIKSKLRKWNGKTACAWDWFLEPKK